MQLKSLYDEHFFESRMTCLIRNQAVIDGETLYTFLRIFLLSAKFYSLEDFSCL